MNPAATYRGSATAGPLAAAACSTHLCAFTPFTTNQSVRPRDYDLRVKSAEVERWFKTTRPPSEGAMRRMRDVILGADASMSERIQYGVTFSSSKSGDFAAFVRYSEPGVNLRLMRGSRLQERYSHLEGGTVKRMRITDEKEASARAVELTAMVKEWCSLGNAARAPKPKRATSRKSAG